MLLRDQAQQTLALLLVPAWIFSELGVRTDGYIGDGVYMGRLCFVWGILYLTFFLGSRRKAVQGHSVWRRRRCRDRRNPRRCSPVLGLLFAPDQSFIPFGTRVWAWVAIAALPLVVAAFHGHKGLIPIAAAIAFAKRCPGAISPGSIRTPTKTGR